MKKRIFALAMVFALIFSICGCGNAKTSSEYTVFEEVVDDGDTAPETSQDANNDNQGNQNQAATNKKPSTVTTSVIGSDGKEVKLANPVYIAEGTKPMDEGLDFGGKTFTMAVKREVAYTSQSFNRLVAAFEKKYNCKISRTVLDFNNYPTLVANANASKKPYDILFCHGSMFPTMPMTSGLVKDLSGYITTADYDTGKGGINMEISSYFAMDKNLYGLASGKYAVFPLVMFYNKTWIEKYGLEDPYELYKAGKWNWSKFREQGKKVTNSAENRYYGDYTFASWGTMLSFGDSVLTWENNKVVNNLNSTNIVKGLQVVSDIFTKSKICWPDQTTSAQYKQFTDGQTFACVAESSKYSAICELVSTSQAFNRKTSNIGVVPIPQDAASAKRGYPCSWYDSVMAGGSDPRVAVAFAKFMSTYNDPVKDKYTYSDEYQDLIDKLISGNIANIHGQYLNTDGKKSTTSIIENNISLNIRLGKDVAGELETYLPEIKSAIEYTMSKKK